MVGGRGDRELFELLRDEKTKKRRPPTPASEVTPDLGEADIHARHQVVLKQETCIFGAIVLLLLLVFTFILGYYKGKNDAPAGVGGTPATSAILPPPESGSSSSTSSSGGDERPQPPYRPAPAVTGPVYALRVWTGGKGASGSARSIVQFLKERHLNAWSKTDREGIKVLVGHFKSRSESAAVRTRNQVRQLIYKGSRAFQDCYFVKVE